jgi:hypothetical protein
MCQEELVGRPTQWDAFPNNSQNPLHVFCLLDDYLQRGGLDQEFQATEELNLSELQIDIQYFPIA